MAEKNADEEKPELSCEVCLKTIDHTEAEVMEVGDYVHHFCGLDCYSKWQNGRSTGKDEKKKD